MRIRGLLVFAVLGCCAGVVSADDKMAEMLYQEGYELYQNEKYYDASKKFEEAGFEATSPVIKANSLKARIASYQMCNLLFREFNAIEELLERFPEYADFQTLADREFELGEAYFKGEREPAYWVFRWVPWLSDKDRSKEIFEKAIERAPFAEQAPKARLRLAYITDQEGRIYEGLDHLRKLIEVYPESKECKYAMLALGEGLGTLARRGDGDGRYAREAYEVLSAFKKRYPDADENAWVDRELLKLQDSQADRLYQIADFYGKNDRPAAAVRYLSQVVQEFPDTQSAVSAEKRLAGIDGTYTPDGFREEPKTRFPRFKMHRMPVEAERILIVPQASGNKYLLPVVDLYPKAEKIPQAAESEEKNSTVSEEEK